MVSKNQLTRLPIYLNYLKNEEKKGTIYVTSSMIAEELHLKYEQVKKDIALFSKKSGTPKNGRLIKEVIYDLEEFLGYHREHLAIIVGVGALGKALIRYDGFKEYGMNIVCGFDVYEGEYFEKKIFTIDRLKDLVKRLNIKLGIITTPKDVAQEVCDKMVSSGIKAIWNFSPVILKVEEGIVVQNESLGSSLAMLSKKLYL